MGTAHAPPVPESDERYGDGHLERTADASSLDHTNTDSHLARAVGTLVVSETTSTGRPVETSYLLENGPS